MMDRIPFLAKNIEVTRPAGPAPTMAIFASKWFNYTKLGDKDTRNILCNFVMMSYRLKSIAALVSLLLILNISVRGQTTEVNFNNFIVEHQSLLRAEISILFDRLADGNISEAKAQQKKCSKKLKQSIKAINKMSKQEEDKALVETAIQLFDFYQDVVDGHAKGWVKLIKKSEDLSQERADLLKIYDELTIKEKELDKALQAAQENYAKEHKIKLKEY